jgi:hypothetical protein
MLSYDQAVETLYRAPFGDFVAERKRLAAELKAAGDQQGATRLGKLARPPVSAWAVNQLWWRERDAFDALVDAAARVKAREREGSTRHREALAELREKASLLLQAAGNAATEPTLRRIATTLSAIAAAAGSFAPDAPGALSSDRDPPGFEAFGIAAEPATAPAPAKAEPREDAAAQRAAEAAQRRAEEEERKRRLAERERLSGALREAQQLQGAQKRELSRLQSELESATQDLKQTQALLAELEEKLANL